jgi:dTMP kinase
MGVKFLVGKLIAVEGIDQAGKRTVCRWLVTELRARGVPTETVGFPDYTTELGEVIAQFLRSEHSYPLEVRQLLYAANRWERAAEIRAWLDSDHAVIIDRYSASNVAYGVAQGLDATWIQKIESGLPRADITLLLDIPPEVSLERKPYQRDVYEARLDLLAGARAAYLDLARDPSWHVIDAAADRDTVRARVLAALEQHAAARGGEP